MSSCTKDCVQGRFCTCDLIHVVPLNDLREHKARIDCWCKPSEENEWPGIWTHHAMDKREKYESGELREH